MDGTYLIKQYVALRDAKRVIEKRHEAELGGITELMDKVEGRLTFLLDTMNVPSIKTPEGSAFKSVKFTASVSDPDTFMNYVLATQNFDLLDRKANVTAVRKYVEDNHGLLPPGANLSSKMTLGVRRPKEK